MVVESSYLMRQKKHASKTQMTLEKKLHLGTASDEEEEALIEEGEKWRQNEEGRNGEVLLKHLSMVPTFRKKP